MLKNFAFILLLALVGARGNAQTAALDLDEAWWAAKDPDGIQRVHIRCGADFFDPSRIVVRANIPLELIVSTTTDAPSHHFVLQLPGPKSVEVDEEVSPGPKTFPFIPGLAGRYVALCRDLGPPGRRKQGTLIVIP